MRIILTLTLSLLASTALAKPLFDSLDTNKDGVLSRAEMMQDRMNRFALIDANNNNSINRGELATGGQSWAGFDPEAITAFMVMYDTNGDGKASLEEVQKTLEEVDIFANLDFNNDDVIDRDEARDLFDTTKTGAPPTQTIITELSQGRRAFGQFRPIYSASLTQPRTVVETVIGDTITGPTMSGPTPQRLYTPTGQQQPAYAPNYVPQQQPQGRAGWVANTRNTTTGTLPRWLENSRPPEPQPTQQNPISNQSFFR